MIDDPDDLEAAVVDAVGAPAVRTPEGDWSWVDLRPLRASLVAEHGDDAVNTAGALIVRPLGVTLDDWRVTTWSDGRALQHLGPDAGIRVHDLEGGGGTAAVSFLLGAPIGASVRVVVDGREVRTVRPGPRGSVVSVDVPLRGPESVIELRSDAEPARMQTSGTPASVYVTDVRAVDAEGRRRVEQLG